MKGEGLAPEVASEGFAQLTITKQSLFLLPAAAGEGARERG